MDDASDVSDEDMQARQEAFRQRQRPENEAPVSVAMDAVLLEGPDSVVLLGNVQAFSNGVAFSITAMTRRPDPTRSGGISGLHGYDRPGSLLLGIEYADGRAISTVDGPRAFSGDPASNALALWPGGGGGGCRYADADFFLSPLPPPGAIRFIAAWPSLGLPETTTEISADPILTAVGGVRRLWDWESEPEPRHRRPAPEVPPKWRRRIRRRTAGYSSAGSGGPFPGWVQSWPSTTWDTHSVPSPGGWSAPAKAMPGWRWGPVWGLRSRLDRMPWWVRTWSSVPLLDRYAYVWMWYHGGWDVLPPGVDPEVPTSDAVR